MARPFGHQALSVLGGDERGLLGQMACVGVSEAPRPPDRVRGWVDRLEVLSLVLEDARVGEPARRLVIGEKAGDQGRPAPVEPAHEDDAFRRQRAIVFCRCPHRRRMIGAASGEEPR